MIKTREQALQILHTAVTSTDLKEAIAATMEIEKAILDYFKIKNENERLKKLISMSKIEYIIAEKRNGKWFALYYDKNDCNKYSWCDSYPEPKDKSLVLLTYQGCQAGVYKRINNYNETHNRRFKLYIKSEVDAAMH